MAELDPGPRHRPSGPTSSVRSPSCLATIVAFFLHAPLHIEPAVVAVAGAAVMLLVAADDVEDALERVEWSTIFFFVGLFVMVGGARGARHHRRGGGLLGDVTGGSRTAEAMVILWGAAAGSALVDNIPFTAAMIPVVDELQVDGFDDANWWALALGACFGGNATLDRGRRERHRRRHLDRTGQRSLSRSFLAIGAAGHARVASDRHRLPARLPALSDLR